MPIPEKKSEERRVLARVGARELTPEEVARVAGGSGPLPQQTNVITVNPVTGKRDGDG
jgi:hypothetical protein